MRKGYGYADFDSKIKNMPEHIFTIGSMTKSFVAASIMLLQERGKLNVNDTIEKYIPTYKYANKITIHQLLTHTSGVHCFLKNNDPEFFKNMENMDKYHTEEEVFDYFKNYELDFEPGSQYSYSNAGYILLGFIIERVAKQPFKDFVKENIFDVVGMRDTFYDETDIINKDRMATGYNLPLSNHTVARNLHVSITYTSGGIRSTVDDMYKWDQCLYNNSVLSPQSLRAIFTPYKNNYGYGWWIDSLNIQGKQFKQIWHWGCTMGYHGIISRLTDEKTTLIILQNTTSPNLDSPENPESLLKLRDGVFNIIFGN